MMDEEDVEKAKEYLRLKHLNQESQDVLKEIVDYISTEDEIEER